MDLWLDSESWSECDLKKHGMARYWEHPSTEVLMITWALGDDPVNLLDFTSGEPSILEQWDRLVRLLLSENTTLFMHNSPWDVLALANLGVVVPESRVVDTEAQCRAVGLPGALEKACAAVGMGEEDAKIKDGKRLIRLFCMPQPKNHKVWRHTAETRPEDWVRFCDYAVRDVSSMRKLAGMLPAHGDLRV